MQANKKKNKANPWDLVKISRVVDASFIYFFFFKDGQNYFFEESEMNHAAVSKPGSHHAPVWHNKQQTDCEEAA